MRIPICFVLAVGVATVALRAPECRAAAAPVSSASVDAAVKRAKEFLYSKRVKNGTWEVTPSGYYSNDNSPNAGQWGGLTALMTYAMLAAGESPQDPRLAPAIEFLKKADLRGTYALGLRMQVWLLLPPTKDVKALAKRDADKLLAATQANGTARGMHDYTALGGKLYSHSRSQYAVLGLWAAEQMGVEVPGRYWETAEAGWVAHQEAGGGWSYMTAAELPIPATPGMTAAGVATLLITQDYLRTGRGGDCRGNVSNRAIEAGVEWLTKNFDKVATDERYSRDFPFATLYAVERVGVAGGLKYFGPHNWYEVGTAWLLKNQKPDGSFATAAAGGVDLMTGAVVDTAFATLFLARGRAPVAINKLDYTGDSKKPAAWNQRPRDVANAVRWIGRQLELDLNWQVVNLNVPAEELIDAPILYLAGSQPIAITDEQAAKLKAYVEMGGMIVANADCASDPFAASFRKLGQQLFGGDFRELPAGHLIYHGLYSAANWKVKPQVQGLTNGVRETMLLIQGGDPARVWQSRAVQGHEEAWQLAANIFKYTFEQRSDLGFKGDAHFVTPDRSVAATRKVSVARLEHGGNWDPEPGGWRRLGALLHNGQGLDVGVEAVRPGEGKLAGHQVAHLTGTGKFALGDAAVAELRAFVGNGGTLVVDAAGGSAEFADAADALVRALFADAAARPLPDNHPLYMLDGRAIPVEYRRYARKNLVGNTKGGRLLGVEVNNRLGVVVSREDLSVGMAGVNVDGILGYTPQTATSLMSAVVLSAAPKAPATGPTTRPAVRVGGGK